MSQAVSRELQLIKEGRKAPHYIDSVGNIVSKQCSSCGYFKNLSYFSRQKGNFLDKRSICKHCSNVNNRKWRQENKDKKLEYDINWQKENKDRKLEYDRNWYKQNKEKAIVRRHKRRTLKKLLYLNIGNGEWFYIKSSIFNNKCSISSGKSTSLHMEHFIPISIGHGGTYRGNIYPMDGSLNDSKYNKNPFEWIKTRDDIDLERWQRLVEYLAKENGLTVNEFRDFVYWCFNNQRTEDEILADRRPSIEIWREAIGVQFPLPKYALNEIGNRSTTETSDCLATV